MTTEDDFQKLLDENYDDDQTRLIFADWLQERGDPRAEGYRALGVNGRHPCKIADPGEVRYEGSQYLGQKCPYYTRIVRPSMLKNPHTLPTDWFDAVELPGKRDVDAPRWFQGHTATRRECDDAAALAFTKLPAERRAQILGGRL